MQVSITRRDANKFGVGVWHSRRLNLKVRFAEDLSPGEVVQLVAEEALLETERKAQLRTAIET